MARHLRKWIALGAIAALAALVMAGYLLAGIRVSLTSEGPLPEIRLPPGFRISVFADGLGSSALPTPGPNQGPRMMLLKDGVLYTTLPSQGKVVALFDADGDGRSERRTTLIEGLRNPHGIDYAGGWFYVAEETRVIRFRDADGDSVADPGSLKVVVDGLPAGGHFTRTIKIRNGSLYISAGSSCNVCEETDPWRAAITRCDLDGSNCTPFARGLRNAVGMVFDPAGRLYATENGRDLLGEDVPPDEINLVEEGRNYGWPVCYGKRIHDTEFDKNVYARDPCADTEPSLVDLPAHSAPLGLAFYDGELFPADYRGNLFVSFHGSWNRAQPTGYKIVRVNLTTGNVSDFAVGWLQGKTALNATPFHRQNASVDGGFNVLGRPVDVIVDQDGGLLVSDDNAGRIYRITYAGRR